ncbi:MAG: O-antigen ligase family protein, partial [Actinomycetes bacterium]
RAAGRRPVKPTGAGTDALQVTTLVDPAAPTAATPHTRTVVPVVLAAVVVATVAWCLVPLAQGMGGRSRGLLSTGLVLLVVALATASLPVVHRSLPISPRAAWLATWLAGAALLVTAVTPPGAYLGSYAASYGYAAGLAVLVAGWARQRTRRELLLGLVAVSGAVEAASGLVPWWGGGGSTPGPMVGTFYWYNQFAIFVVAGALAGAILVADATPVWRSVGWVALIVCPPAVVVSSSRASLAVLGVGLAGILALAGWIRGWRAGGRVLVALGLSGGLLVLLTGPPLFAHRFSPWEAATARVDIGQTLTQNGTMRLDFWREAVEVFVHHPLAGGGYGSLPYASRPWVPAGFPLSPFVHNGFLQAFSDGGLLLGVPLLVATLVLAAVGARRLVGLLRRRTGLLDAGIVILVAGMAGHGAVDFDWSYPALFGLFGILAGLLLAIGAGPVIDHGPGAGSVDRPVAGRTLVRLLPVGALVLALAVGAVLAQPGGMRHWQPTGIGAAR